MKNMTAMLVGASLALTLSTSHAAQPPAYGVPDLDARVQTLEVEVPELDDWRMEFVRDAAELEDEMRLHAWSDQPDGREGWPHVSGNRGRVSQAVFDTAGFVSSRTSAGRQAGLRPAASRLGPR